MRIYLVMRERTRKIPADYGDYGNYWETEADIISAYTNPDSARKGIETETFLNGDEYTRYYLDYIDVEEEIDGKIK